MQRLIDYLNVRVSALWQTTQVRRAFEHVHGPERVALSPDQVALVSMVKDAAWFLRPFLEHHFSLGVAHVLLIDNGSTDGTVDIARQFRNVTILRNLLPAKRHEVLLRACGTRRVVRGGWILFADADEMAEPPIGDLGRLCRYANTHGYTAFLGQMIDMFSPLPHSEQATMDYRSALAACRYWSDGGLLRLAYGENPHLRWFLDQNSCEDREVLWHEGGLRAEVFGERPVLTKHSLVRNLPGVRLMTHPHCAGGVRVADVTIALRHYKLAGAWRDRDRASVAAGTWNHSEDLQRTRVANDEAFRIAPTRSLEWHGAANLLDLGVLYASRRARQLWTMPRLQMDDEAGNGSAPASAHSASVRSRARLFHTRSRRRSCGGEELNFFGH